MSLRLRALDLWLRLVEKPFLSRVREPEIVRRRLERQARRLFRPPPGTRRTERRADGVRLVEAWVGGRRPARVVLYLHGGAFLMGSPETHEALAVFLAAGADASAALPDYRLAPENAHPAALEDALAAYRSVLATGVAPQRVAFAGDSAGGGLAFSLLLAARRAGLPDPAAIVAFSPWVDMTARAASLRTNARSDAMLPVSRIEEVVGWRMAEGDREDALASPVFARFDRPPPPTLIQIGRGEILEDDARGMAETLRRGGGEVRLEWTGRTPHAVQLGWRWLPEGRWAVERASTFLRERFTASTASAPGRAA